MHLDLSIKHKTVIVAPLSWGLGHASRCIPIINNLLDQANEVHIATDSEAFELLSAEFPHVPIHRLPAYDIKYKHHSMLLNMGTQASKIWKAIKAEHRAAQRLAHKVKADIIISDNRLGFRSSYTHNIYLTHQLSVLASNRLTTYLATGLHKSYYQNFDEIWVPDYGGKGALAPRLSACTIDMPVKYIGPVSRLAPAIDKSPDYTYDLAIILSGPEPQRSIFEQQAMAKVAGETDKRIVLVRGSNTAEKITPPAHIDVFDMLTTRKLSALINKSKKLLCRAGYSTVMDLVSIHRGATLVPTPGQHEQEYLGTVLHGKHGFVCIRQSDFTANFRI